GYARAQAALLYGMAFVLLVETVGVGVLLRDMPTAHAVTLVADVYTVLMVLGAQAAAVTRPHVLTADTLLLRAGAGAELRIPLRLVGSARYDLRSGGSDGGGAGAGSGGGGGGVLQMAVAGQTTVTVELVEPVVAVRLLGRREMVRTVRFHADDARGAVTAIRAAVAAAGEAVAAAGEAQPVADVPEYAQGPRPHTGP
ncbi:hypothetical protein ADL22_02220, partial [Streptomyces sp. NRRL F-4489]|uniref:hypothetical protein n=1 Tax=Streptomyces sp. NRRL F-4489 TaxID=1609095 RepID=UPI0007489A4E